MIETSIIVPVYNDATGLERTVNSIEPQLTPTTELIIVDNDSSDQTPQVAADLADDDRIRATTESKIQSSYAARNTGIRQARGDTLAFVDADTTVCKGWLAAGHAALEDAPYVGCRIDLVTRDDQHSLAARYDRATAFPVYQYLESQRFAPTCGLFVRRSVFDTVGVFDSRLSSGGDKEFGNRVARAGFEQCYAPRARLEHPVRDSIAALARKELRIGAGVCQLQRYYPDRYGMAGRPPSPSGIKSPDETRTQLSSRVLSAALTAVRGLGYYREFLRLLRTDTGGSTPEAGRPTLAAEISGGSRDE